jgi:hypothetical protein
MTIDLGHGVTAIRDTTRAASWRVYISGLFYARVSTEAIARCIRANRAAA